MKKKYSKKKEIESLNSNNISYENRILALDCDNSIKSKAFDKFNEINNKDNCSKPKQYLDGLLKIPFNIYHKEEIFNKYDNFCKILDNFIIIFNTKLSSYENILDNDIYNILLETINKYYELNNSENNINKNLNYLINIYYYLKKKINYNNNNNDLINKFNKLELNILDDNIISNNNNNKKIIELYNNCVIKLNYYNNIRKILFDNNILNNKQIKNIKNNINNLENNIKEYDKNITQTIIKNNITYDNTENDYNKNDINYFYKFIINEILNILNEWDIYKNDKIKYINNVKNTLDNCVYGHNNVKTQIQRLIGQWINGEMKGHCIGLVGPPGIGKTTICKDGISKCLVNSDGKTRPFAFLALGGSTNGSLLVGHSYTYLGSTWGKIVDILIETQCMNPIIYIDELDKVSNTEHGKEITNILTHLTDPVQNKEFQDKYFSGIPLDLSKVLFIFSYNNKSKIDRILRDRIQEVNISALNKREKLIISQRYVLPEICKTIGFSQDEIIFNKEEVIELIDSYTYEAGVRKLNEIYFDIIREINLMKITDNNIKFPFTVTKEFIKKILYDKPKISRKIISKKSMIGLVNGLYATEMGIGGITLIEVMKTPTERKFSIEKLTGSQGDVMKESMQCALTLVWNLLPDDIADKIMDNGSGKNRGMGLHIHCPEASTPKDGPSAGCAIVTAIISQICGIPVRNTVAMTGEIDLNGNVHNNGGLDAKLNGALMAGIKKVLIPFENKSDYELILKKEKKIELTSSVNLKTDNTKTFITNNLTVKYVKNINEVLKHALVKNNLKFKK